MPESGGRKRRGGKGGGGNPSGAGGGKKGEGKKGGNQQQRSNERKEEETPVVPANRESRAGSQGASTSSNVSRRTEPTPSFSSRTLGRLRRGLLGRGLAKLEVLIFQFNVTFGLYMLDWWERQIIYWALFLILWALLYHCYRLAVPFVIFLFEHPRFNGGRINGDAHHVYQ
eukprot:TRINITY_DN5511_c0_g1_i1.p1 TRINITY_DN5511_c0_g1~~TRINITY_DN5511_c0_g1_i1.p1  ORF type:complete len:171 (+),score=38.65 TRINITY_DN5511_c0_g1_i1:711-1223(+)